MAAGTLQQACAELQLFVSESMDTGGGKPPDAHEAETNRVTGLLGGRGITTNLCGTEAVSESLDTGGGEPPDAHETDTN